MTSPDLGNKDIYAKMLQETAEYASSMFMNVWEAQLQGVMNYKQKSNFVTYDDLMWTRE